MIDFVNPGLLGSLSTFSNIFAKAIQAGRDKNASVETRKMGETRSAEVSLMHCTVQSQILAAVNNPLVSLVSQSIFRFHSAEGLFASITLFTGAKRVCGVL